MRKAAWIAAVLLVAAAAELRAGPPDRGDDTVLIDKLAGGAKAVSIQLPPHVLMGGEDFGTATPIPSLPFSDGGNTCSSLDDYSPPCAFAGRSTAPDVVYVFHASTDACVDISLCGSGFDTVLHVYENAADTLIACNDDRCGLQSQVTGLALSAGKDYYIVVDGWAAGCGDYLLGVTPVPETVSGTIMYHAPEPLPNTNYIPNVQVCISPPGPPSGCQASGATGNYKVPGAVPGAIAVEATRAPDPADAGAIGGGDASVLVRVLAGQLNPPLTADQGIAADVDESGTVDSSDFQLLRRFIVFDLAACPWCCTWKFFCDPLATNQPSPCAVTLPTCTNLTVDLKGILRGDIDGSWPQRFKATGASPPALAFGPVAWSGSEFSLPVRAAVGEMPLASLIFSLDYDPIALEYVGAAVSRSAAGYDLTLNPDTPGVVHGLLLAGVAGASSLDEMLELRFRMRQGHSRATLSFGRLLVDDRDAESVPALVVARGDETQALPQRFHLRALPNPFNPSAEIEYSLPVGSGPLPVSLRVVDLSGRLVRTLVQTQAGPGSYRSAWDGTDGDGQFVANGVYLLQLRAGSMTSTQKAVLLK